MGKFGRFSGAKMWRAVCGERFQRTIEANPLALARNGARKREAVNSGDRRIAIFGCSAAGSLRTAFRFTVTPIDQRSGSRSEPQWLTFARAAAILMSFDAGDARSSA